MVFNTSQGRYLYKRFSLTEYHSGVKGQGRVTCMEATKPVFTLFIVRKATLVAFLFGEE